MDNEKKIWAWYDAPNSIYAFTDKKDIKVLFEMERKLKSLKRKTHYMTDDEFEEFKRIWRGCRLSKIKIYNGTQYVDFIASEREETGLDDECDTISHTISTSMYYLDKIPFKKKYKKLFETVTNEVFSDISELPFYELNTCELYNFDEFLIFCKKYGDTIF